MPVVGHEVERSPSSRKTWQNSASQSRAALSAMMSNTGWTSVGELEMTRRISPVAVCCSRVSVRSRLRASSSCEQPDVLDCDDRLVGEGLQQLDLLVGERPGSARVHDDGADGRAVAQHRHGEDAPIAGRREHAWSRYRGPRSTSGIWTRRPVEDRPAARLCRAGRHRDRRVEGSSASGRHVVRATRWTSSPSNREDCAESASHRRTRAARDGLEDGLDVGGRARDDTQDLARRRLLLQRLGQALLELVTTGGLLLQRLTTTSPAGCGLGLRAFRLRGLRTPTHPPLLHLSAALRSRGDSRQAGRMHRRGQAARVQSRQRPAASQRR